MDVSFSDLSPALKSLAIYGWAVMTCTIIFIVYTILIVGVLG